MPSRGLIWGLILWWLTGSITGSQWRFSNPRPHGNHIYEMVFRDGVVWQAGDRGRLYTSPDLNQWTPHETGTTKSLRGIAFLGATAFICGEEGTLLAGASPDSLRGQSIATSDWLEAIAASESAVVAVGDNWSIYSSSGNGTWTRRGSYTTWLRGVAYGANQFLCVGEDGFIARSADGESWDQLTSGTTTHLNRISWLQGRFWVVGDEGTVLTNNLQMGFARVDVGVTNHLLTVTANSTEVVVAGDGMVLLRNPLTGTWSRQADASTATLAPVWPYYSSLWDGRLFLLGGHSGMLVEGFRTNAAAPLIWYSDIQPTRSWLWSATHVGDLYAAVGANGTVVTSDDGVEWAREVIPEAAREQVLLGIGGTTNMLLAAGSGGTILRSLNTFTNAVTTNSLGQPVTNRVSLLGIHWNQMTVATTEDLQGVAAGTGQFIVTGGGGSIFTSTDGAVWQPRVSGVTTYLYSVRWLGSKLVAVGENGLILTSDNGVDWTRRQSGATEWLNDVTFAQGSWFVAGSGGIIVTSADAVTWTVTEAITSNSLYGAASDGEQVILAGMEGSILRQASEVPDTPVNIVAFEHVGPNSVFLFAGVIDQQFILEESVSVNGPWAPVAALELTQPPGTLIYELPGNDSPAKFFRTRLLRVP